MYCKNCGKQIDDDAKFCPYCGAAVNGNNNDNNGGYNGGYNSYNTNSYAPNNQPAPVAKEYNILAILGIIFSVIGLGSIVMGISGLVCSIIGFKHAVKEGKHKGLAIAGIAVGIIAVILQLVLIIIDIVNGYGYIDGAVYY